MNYTHRRFSTARRLLAGIALGLSSLAALPVAFAATVPATPTHAQADAALPSPHHVAVDSHSKQSATVILAARRYAAFWNTGDTAYADLALSPAFVDRTLPDGRPQGPDGPRAASKGFRAAVPDLSAEVDDLVVAGDRASVHLHFRGHFTGEFQGVKGNGQIVDFRAFDLYRVEGGKIVENWHLEDNLTLLKQLGVIKS